MPTSSSRSGYFYAGACVLIWAGFVLLSRVAGKTALNGFDLTALRFGTAAVLLFPAWLFNLGFLRMLRLWTLLNSDFFWRTVGARFDDTRVEGIVRALSGLVTFVFVVTGFVYATFRGHDGISGYIDALYFTVATLTTTGFGDVTLPGPLGKLLSIAIMLVGITLFLRLAQALIKPHKVRHPCDRCGLQTHDPDAVHCKACGNLICIPDEG